MNRNLSPLVITNWSVLSSIGIGKKDFAKSVLSEAPAESKKTIESFQVSSFLGKKGVRLYDRPTQFATVASHLIFQEMEDISSEIDRDMTGVVLGTTFGSIKSSCDFMKEMLLSEKYTLIDPTMFPNTVMNTPSSQVAIRFKLRGLNTTLSGGEIAAYNALRYAMNSLENGYSDTLLVGSVEEKCDPLEWGLNQVNQDNNEMGEGAGFVVLERYETAAKYDREPIAEVLSCVTEYCHSEDKTSLKNTISSCMKKAYKQAGLSIGQQDIFILNSCLESDELFQVEKAAIEENVGSHYSALTIKSYVGECYSAAGSLQLAAYLAMLENRETYVPNLGLMIMIGVQGAVGCTLVRRWNS